MGTTIMLKAFGRSALLTSLLVIVVLILSHFGILPFNYIVVTLLAIIFIWLSVMLYLDPPEDWDHK
jgi:uncharacterized membrane protein YccC